MFAHDFHSHHHCHNLLVITQHNTTAHYTSLQAQAISLCIHTSFQA